MTSHGTPKGEPGGVSTIRKTPPYWGVVSLEGPAVQPTLVDNNETNITITNPVNPTFKPLKAIVVLVNPANIIFSSFL
jgi:hypothetical protein